MSDELVSLYRDDDRTRCRFIGGPGDGTTLTIPDSKPPMRLLHPIDPGPPTLADLDGPPSPSVRAAEYEPVLDELGFPSRTDDGAYRYEYRGQR